MTNLQLPVCALVAANTAKNMKMTTETKTRGDLIFLSLANLINSKEHLLFGFSLFIQQYFPLVGDISRKIASKC